MLTLGYKAGAYVGILEDNSLRNIEQIGSVRSYI
jgi:hypothetical protein